MTAHVRVIRLGPREWDVLASGYSQAFAVRVLGDRFVVKAGEKELGFYRTDAAALTDIFQFISWLS